MFVRTSVESVILLEVERKKKKKYYSVVDSILVLVAIANCSPLVDREGF